MKVWSRLGVCVLAALCVVASACGDDPVGPTVPEGTQVGVVLSSSDRLLTIFDVDQPSVRTQIGLGPDGTPVTLAVRGNIAVVPLGSVPAAAIVDLREPRLVTTVPLPAGSGATGVAFINDSIALVANTGRNSVTPVNVLRGTTRPEIQVGAFPQVIVAVNDTAYVLNGVLGPDFQPAGPGTISVVAGAVPAVLQTITLSGRNPLNAVAVGNTLYVLNAGSFGAGSGSLSVVDRATRREVTHHTGFGEFPGALAHSADGNLYVGAFAYGVAIWRPATSAFVRTPASAIAPGGIAGTSGLGADMSGRVYALEPECTAPADVFRLGTNQQVELTVPVGICPLAIAFTRVARD